MKNQQHEPINMGAGQPKHYNGLLKVYCKKDLLHLYGVTYKTLAKWLRPMASEIGPLHGRSFTTAQVKIIFDTLGYPGEL